MVITITRSGLVVTALVLVLVALGVVWRIDARRRHGRDQPAAASAAKAAGSPSPAPAAAAPTDGRVITPGPLPPLLAACAAGDGALVASLLEKGARPDQADELGRTALHHAVSAGAGEVVQALLARGADANLGDGRWAPPLALAAFLGNEELVGLLLQAGADVDQADASAGGRTALILAAERGHREVVRQLLAAGARVDARDAAQETALHRAAEEGAVEAGEELVAHAAPLEARDAEGATPLARAKGAMKARFAAMLRAKGALEAAAVPDEASDLRVQPAPPEDEASAMGRPSIELPPGQRAWDGPLLPGRVVSAPCDTPADWSGVPRARTGGFAQGDEAVALTTDGRSIPVRLGELSVRRLEKSRGCWASIQIDGLPPRADVEFLAPPGFLEPESQVLVPRYDRVDQSACAPLPAWKLRWPDRRGCRRVDLGGGDRLLVHSIRQESSKTEWVFARPELPANAPWAYVGRYNGSRLGVALVVRDRHGARLLWSRREQEPNRETTLVTLVGPNGFSIGRALTVEGPAYASRPAAAPRPTAEPQAPAEEFTNMPAIRVEPPPVGGWTTRSYHLIKGALAGSRRHQATWWLGGDCLVGAASLPVGQGREAIAVATLHGRDCEGGGRASYSSFLALLDVTGPEPLEIGRSGAGGGAWTGLARLDLRAVSGLFPGDPLVLSTWVTGPWSGWYHQVTWLEQYREDTWQPLLQFTAGAPVPAEGEPVLTRLEVSDRGPSEVADIVAVTPGQAGASDGAPKRRRFVFQPSGRYAEREEGAREPRPGGRP